MNLMRKLNDAINAAKKETMPDFASLDAAAEMLSLDPDALRTLDATYRTSYQPQNDDLMSYTKQRANSEKSLKAATDEDRGAALDLARNIAQDISLLYSDKLLPSPEDGVADDEAYKQAMALPEEVRPQLTATRVMKDLPAPSGEHLLSMLAQAKHYREIGKEEHARRIAAHMWLGLDMLDLDPISYEMLSANPCSMGYWFPALEKACAEHGDFKVPATIIRKVPLPILQMSRLDYYELTPATLEVADAWCREAFQIDDSKDHFIRTGCYSSKYEFANAHVPAGQESREIGQCLLWLSHQAAEMAGPLQPRPTFGVSTTNEWVVREWIEDVEDNPTIYGGMPLHTEYRVFIDLNRGEVLGMCPYWRADVMEDNLGKKATAGDQKAAHDYVVYKAWKHELDRRYDENKDFVREAAEKVAKSMTELGGQWSLDIMQNGNDFYAIDMAPAARSALCDCVPDGLLDKCPDPDWASALPAAHE